MYFIYVLENLVDGKMYVGQTINLSRRMSNHLSSSSNCRYLKRALAKYGIKNFELVIIERCYSENEANEKEKYWIRELGTMSPNGYNLKEGGEKAGKPGTEAKKKMSEAAKNRKRDFDDEWRENMRQAQLGRKHPEKVKKKISESHKGIGHSNETKEKLRMLNLGKVLSKDHKKKISESLKRTNKDKAHFNKGRKLKLTPEQRQKRSETMKRVWLERKSGRAV